jgi:NAD(P)-dependent dehydrogenase (short-subunit alcohol dehydrogenase family)
MRVAITGHTSGIGQELYNLMPGSLGFSRRTGHDIAKKECREAIWDAAKDCDVFINNAYSHDYMFAQTELLWMFWRGWENSKTEKKIVCIGSYAGTVVDRYQKIQEYAVQKHTLDVACRQLTGTYGIPTKCRILNVKPGYVDTAGLTHAAGAPKIRSQDLARLIVNLITTRDYWVPEITVLPYNDK